MKLMLIAVLLFGAVAAPGAAVRFESDGVRVGSELVTGSAISLKETLLVSGSVVESLSGESLAVALDGRQVVLGAGLRLARTADGYTLSTHGMRFTVEGSGVALAAERTASFKVTEKGFDFGALGAIEGASFAAKVAAAPAVEPAAAQEVQISPEKSSRLGRTRVIRRLFSTDPLNAGNAAGSISVRQIGRVSPNGAP
jgi:hypothetical protein